MTQEDLMLAVQSPMTEKQMEDYRIWREQQEKEFATIQKMYNSHIDWQAGK